jgi:hypothetical protein
VVLDKVAGERVEGHHGKDPKTAAFDKGNGARRPVGTYLSIAPSFGVSNRRTPCILEDQEVAAHRPYGPF